MTTLDQRILVPAPPDVVWDFISDIRNNPRWQTGCTNVVFLTSKVTGPGTRWRQTIDRSGEQVIEISAWYEGLGYQYTYIDGVPFRESTGRIRLQEIPEGTVVQWTITYQMGGLLGGMRNSLGLTKRLETMMVSSLKSLWKQINESGTAQRSREAKSLMREAPDAEARANYKPRHTPVIDIRAEAEDQVAPEAAPVAETTISEDDARFRPPEGHAIVEPAIAEDDTRPRKPIETPAPSEPLPRRKSIPELVETSEEPEFLDDMARFAPPPKPVQEDTQPVKPAETGSPAAETQPDIMAEFTLDESDFAPPKQAERPAESNDDNLREEISAITYQPESWDEPQDEPIAGIALGEAVEQPADDSDAQTEPALKPVETEDKAVPVENKQTATTPFNGTPQDETDTPTATSPRIDESSFGPPVGTDTSKMTIWEVFGVPRPSETTEQPAVEPEQTLLDQGTQPAAEPAQSDVAATTEESDSPAQAALDATSEPDIKLSTGELTIVEVIREVSGPRRRTGLRKRLRRQKRRLHRPL